MVYVLERISLQDQEKIISDASFDVRKRDALVAREHFKYNVDLNWAIDRERGFYMFWAPRLREQSSDCHYYFYFKGRLYAIHIKGMFGGGVVYFDDTPPSSLMSELQDEIKAAFAVYGRMGQGVVDEMDVVAPEFKAEE